MLRARRVRHPAATRCARPSCSSAAGIPLVASIAVGPGELDGFLLPQGTDGHLVVVRGFTPEGDPIVNDPAAESNAAVRRVYDRAQFERAWLGGSGGVVYVIQRAGDRAAAVAGQLVAPRSGRRAASPHAAAAVVGERAPEREAAGPEARLELAGLPGMHDPDPVGARAADAAEREIVVVLAVVDELDDRRRRGGSASARA